MSHLERLIEEVVELRIVQDGEYMMIAHFDGGSHSTTVIERGAGVLEIEVAAAAILADRDREIKRAEERRARR